MREVLYPDRGKKCVECLVGVPWSPLAIRCLDCKNRRQIGSQRGRICKTCGCDITDLFHNAMRCKPCARQARLDAFNRANARRAARRAARREAW